MLSDSDVLVLSDLIIQNLRQEFQEKHLSGNLLNTITVEKTEDGIAIIIPAQIYNMYKYFKDGVIIPDGSGSYASRLDKEGSAFMWYPKRGEKGKRKLVEPRNHIGFIDKAINNALGTWKEMMSNKYDVKQIN